MADRTAADIFGRVFACLVFAQEEAGMDVRELALSILELTNDYDFTPHQMGADIALRTLGIYDEAYEGWEVGG